jgi:hypothetical protein
LALSDNPYVFTAVGNLVCLTGYRAGLQVVDIGDPANPVLIARYGTNTAVQIGAQKMRVFVADSDEGLVSYKLNVSPRVVSYLVGPDAVCLRDRPLRIEWGSDGISDAHWTVRLQKTGTTELSLNDPPQTDGNGHWSIDWKAPETLSDGCGYTFLIRDEITGAETITKPFCLRTVPAMQASLADSQMTVQWSTTSTGWRLFTAESADGNWTRVESGFTDTGGFRFYKKNAASGAQYFRLQAEDSRLILNAE